MMLAVITTMLTACNAGDEQSAEEQPAEPQAISFSAYVNRGTTRGGTPGEVSTTSLQSTTGTHYTSGFGVFAYYTDGQLYSQTDLPNFMYNQKVLYDAISLHQWTYTPVKYWPNETGSTTSEETDRLTFFAYAPYTEVSSSTGRATDNSATGIVSLSRSTDNGDPMVRYYASLNPTEAVDLCWGTPQIDQTKPALDSKVNFNFKHALAALNVQIDADVDVTAHDAGDNPDSQTRIYVRSVTFAGFAIKGQLNLNSDPAYPPIWNNLDCDCDVTSQPITIHDGRRDGKEGVAVSLNERNASLNPQIVQSNSYTVTTQWDNIANVPLGVTNTAVNLFDVSNWPFADPANPTDAELAAALAAPIYVIPTNEPLRVTIVYDVETYDPKLVSQYLSDGKTHGSTIENNLTTTITTGSPATSLLMTAGSRYKINLHLGMTSVKVETSVSQWPTTGYDANVDVPQ
jgi:hypothetical protein